MFFYLFIYLLIFGFFWEDVLLVMHETVKVDLEPLFRSRPLLFAGCVSSELLKSKLAVCMIKGESFKMIPCSSLKVKRVRAGILLSNSSGPLGPWAIVWVISEGPLVLWVCGLELRLRDLGNRYVGLGEKSADRLGFCL